jgi:hypothetical protein
VQLPSALRLKAGSLVRCVRVCDTARVPVRACLYAHMRTRSCKHAFVHVFVLMRACVPML